MLLEKSFFGNGISVCPTQAGNFIWQTHHLQMMFFLFVVCCSLSVMVMTRLGCMRTSTYQSMGERLVSVHNSCVGMNYATNKPQTGMHPRLQEVSIPSACNLR